MSFFLKHLGMVALVLLPAFASAALQNGLIEVGKIVGTATVTDANKTKKPLASGAVLKEGIVIETGAASTIELSFSNGSTVMLSPATTLEIRNFKQVASEAIIAGGYRKLDKEPSPSVTEIEVLNGKITGEVRKLNAMSSYVVRTPVGMTRIRGTIYNVEYRHVGPLGNTVVSCIRGQVETTVADSNYGPLTIEPGTQLVATAYDLSVPRPAGGQPVPPATVAVNTAKPVAGQEPTLPIRAVAGTPGKVLIIPITGEEYELVVAILEASNLPAEIAKTVSVMVGTAPREVDLVWNGSFMPRGVELLDGTKTREEARGENKTGSPTGPNTTTTGGGGLTDASKKILDNVQRTVEGSKQPVINPTPTGG